MILLLNAAHLFCLGGIWLSAWKTAETFDTWLKARKESE